MAKGGPGTAAGSGQAAKPTQRKQTKTFARAENGKRKEPQQAPALSKAMWRTSRASLPRPHARAQSVFIRLSRASSSGQPRSRRFGNT